MNLSRRISKKVMLLVAGDALLFYAALVLTIRARYGAGIDSFIFKKHLLPFSMVFVLWLLAFGAIGLYDLRLARNGTQFLLRLGRAIAINTILAIMAFYVLPFGIEPRRNLALMMFFTTALIFSWRYLVNLFIIRARGARVLFLGMTNETIELADLLRAHPQLGYTPAGIVTNGEPLPNRSLPQVPHFSLDREHFDHIVRDTRSDTMVLSRSLKDNPIVVRALLGAIPRGIAVMEFPAFHEMLTGKVPLSLIEEAWFLENLIGMRKRTYDFFKRLTDLVFGAVCGVLTLVILPFIALGIALSTPTDALNHRRLRARPGDGVIFFRQTRVGKNGRPFEFIKFRSQRLGAERMGEAKEFAEDPRQYPFGRFLRSFYLDELPQCWNVLRGEMSFVGPRPERPEFVEEMKKKVPFYETRFLVPPGLSGWAQIKMENDASVEDAPEKMQYDLYYIKNRSLLLDALILLKTIAAILRRQGR